jgi:hypothetical protein
MRNERPPPTNDRYLLSQHATPERVLKAGPNTPDLSSDFNMSPALIPNFKSIGKESLFKRHLPLPTGQSPPADPPSKNPLSGIKERYSQVGTKKMLSIINETEAITSPEPPQDQDAGEKALNPLLWTSDRGSSGERGDSGLWRPERGEEGSEGNPGAMNHMIFYLGDGGQGALPVLLMSRGGAAAERKWQGGVLESEIMSASHNRVRKG